MKRPAKVPEHLCSMQRVEIQEWIDCFKCCWNWFLSLYCLFSLYLCCYCSGTNSLKLALSFYSKPTIVKRVGEPKPFDQLSQTLYHLTSSPSPSDFALPRILQHHAHLCSAGPLHSLQTTSLFLSWDLSTPFLLSLQIPSYNSPLMGHLVEGYFLDQSHQPVPPTNFPQQSHVAPNNIAFIVSVFLP